MFKKPSFYSLVLTGLLILIAIVMMFQNWKKIDRVNAVLLIGILIGVHGLLHLGFEAYYKYNPLESGKWY